MEDDVKLMDNETKCGPYRESASGLLYREIQHLKQRIMALELLHEIALKFPEGSAEEGAMWAFLQERRDIRSW